MRLIWPPDQIGHIARHDVESEEVEGAGCGSRALRRPRSGLKGSFSNRRPEESVGARDRWLPGCLISHPRISWRDPAYRRCGRATVREFNSTDNVINQRDAVTGETSVRFQALSAAATPGARLPLYSPVHRRKRSSRSAADISSPLPCRVGTIAKGRGAKADMVRSVVENRLLPVSISELARECPGVSRPTIRRVLERMRDEGSIEAKGKGPAHGGTNAKAELD